MDLRVCISSRVMLTLLLWITLWKPLLSANSFSQNCPCFPWDQHYDMTDNSPFTLALGRTLPSLLSPVVDETWLEPFPVARGPSRDRWQLLLCVCVKVPPLDKLTCLFLFPTTHFLTILLHPWRNLVSGSSSPSHFLSPIG